MRHTVTNMQFSRVSQGNTAAAIAVAASQLMRQQFSWVKRDKSLDTFACQKCDRFLLQLNVSYKSMSAIRTGCHLVISNDGLMN